MFFHVHGWDGQRGQKREWDDHDIILSTFMSFFHSITLSLPCQLFPSHYIVIMCLWWRPTTAWFPHPLLHLCGCLCLLLIIIMRVVWYLCRQQGKWNWGWMIIMSRSEGGIKQRSVHHPFVCKGAQSWPRQNTNWSSERLMRNIRKSFKVSIKGIL